MASSSASDYCSAVTEITIHHASGHPTTDGSVRVRLRKADSGDLLILLLKNGNEIELHPEEFLSVCAAAGKLLRR